MDAFKRIGTCLPVFVAAVVFDVVGLVVLLVGIFADLRVDGQFYGDFLIYSGSLIVFFSLGMWLIWYVGNIQVPDDGFKPRSSFVELAGKLSRRLTQRLKGDGSVKCPEDESYEPAAGKAGRVTWGKSTAYLNEGYDDSHDEKEAKSPEPAPPDDTGPDSGSQV